MANDFEREFRPVRVETGGPTFEIPTDWLGWGDYIEVNFAADAHGDGPWKAFFLLARLDGDLSNRFVNFDEIRAHALDGCSSNFRISPAMADPRISLAGVPIPFVLRRGQNDVLAAIELHDFEATDVSDAAMLARTYFNYLSATFAYAFNLPLRFRALHVERSNEPAEYAVRLFMPWAEAEISPFGFEVPAGVASRLLLMYADGVMSNSQVYRFLCFFKVVDHVLRVGGPALRKIREKRFSKAPWLNFDDVLPEDPIARYDAALVSKTYCKAYERYSRTQLRNAVAHVLATDETFEPLDPVHESHYRAGADFPFHRPTSHSSRHREREIHVGAWCIGGRPIEGVLSEDAAKAITACRRERGPVRWVSAARATATNGTALVVESAPSAGFIATFAW